MCKITLEKVSQRAPSWKCPKYKINYHNLIIPFGALIFPISDLVVVVIAIAGGFKR